MRLGVRRQVNGGEAHSAVEVVGDHEVRPEQGRGRHLLSRCDTLSLADVDARGGPESGVECVLR